MILDQIIMIIVINWHNKMLLTKEKILYYVKLLDEETEAMWCGITHIMLVFSQSQILEVERHWYIFN